MKYFTPRIFIGLQSSDSDKADRAADDFEQAYARYGRRLYRIRRHFSRAVEQLALELQSHDAEILSLARQDGQLVAVLRRFGFSARIVILTYTLTREPRIDPSALPRRYSSIKPCWLYDEVDISKDKNEFHHRILLSNGWEIELPFREVMIFEAEGILPSQQMLEVAAANLIEVRSDLE
jgi:hypothetical protein